MKRSEALDIIDGILDDHGLPLLSGVSKEILTALEQAGMLPPSYKIKEGDEFSCSTWSYYIDGIDDWESEDDCK